MISLHVFLQHGQQLAFLTDRSGRTQIYLLDLRGGEARQLTHFSHKVSALQWSPDGRHLSFVLHQQSEMDPAVVFVTERLNHQANSAGLLTDPVAQLHLLDLQTGEVHPVSHSSTPILEHQWLPDGSGVAWIASPTDLHGGLSRQAVYRKKLEGATEQITEGKHQLSGLSIQPEGTGFVVLQKEHNWQDAHLWYYHWDGASKRLDEDFDYPVGNLVAGDMQVGSYPTHPQWLSNHTLLAVYTLGGSSGLFRVELSGGVSPLVHHHARSVAAFTVHGGRIAFIEESPTELPEVYLWDGGEVTPVSQQGALIADWSVCEPIPLRVGNVEGWLMKPEHPGPHPVILSIHGGPHAAYGQGFMHEFQVMVQQGYAVLYCNPRGSVGYGQGHSKAIHGRWGTVDFEDLLSFLEGALGQFQELDSDRLGLMGGSYGGYMVNWITAHTSRFKRAITDRSICNMLSFCGTSDIGSFFLQHEMDANPYSPEGAEALWNASPLKYVSQVSTPTLVLHSEQDLRCPLEQALQWYTALKLHGVETRFVRFPEENHELSRSGRPDRRVIRLQEYLNWFKTL